MTTLTEDDIWKDFDALRAQYLESFAQLGEITTHEWALKYYKRTRKKELDLAATELNRMCEAEPPTMTRRPGRNSKGRPCILYKAVTK